MSGSAPEANGSCNGAGHAITDIEKYLSTDGRARQSGSLSKLIFKFTGIPDVVGFHGGTSGLASAYCGLSSAQTVS